MWPFKKKEMPDSPSAWVAEDQCAQSAVNAIAEEFPLGSSFAYLGRNMVVRAHSETMWMHGGAFGGGWIVDAPALIVDYSDENGVIRSKTFDANGVIALMKSRK